MVQAIPEVYRLLQPQKPNGHYISNSETLIGAIEETVLEFPEDSFYYFNENALRERIRLVDQHFLPDNPNKFIAYAIKANTRRRILEILYEEGMTHFDCASPIEIEYVKQLNPKTVPLYNHPKKRRVDIHEAARMGTSHFTVQERQEIDKILSSLNLLPSNLAIVARMQTLNDKAACNLSTKFGAERAKVVDMLRFLNKNRINRGISVHTGSQNSDPNTMKEGVEKMVDVIRETGRVQVLNVGGGLPVNYLGDREYDIRDFLQLISQAVNEVLEEVCDDENHKVIIEPGRAIIGDAVQLVAPIISTEERNGTSCIFIYDGIFTSFCPADPPNFNAGLKVLRREGSRIVEVDTNETKEFMVFGRTCDSADKLGLRTLPADTQEGDWILHTTAGAYAESCSSDFNNFTPHTWVSYKT